MEIEKLDLVDPTDTILTTECQAFDFNDPPFDIASFSHNLIKFMYTNNGVGLAANQVGIPYKIFAMRGVPENFVVINPRIVYYSDKKISLEEGCLSYPNLIIPIKRADNIRVRFNTPNGDTLTRQFIGMTARIFQHEFDHINGKLFFDNSVSRFHLERALKKAKNRGNDFTKMCIMKYAK